MREADRDILERFKTLLAVRVRIDRLILFGSRARGDADRESDMDVVVVVDEPVTVGLLDSAWEAGFGQGVVLVPVVFSRDEWNTETRLGSLLAFAVEREGVPV
jgi:predicted nucleotidyltransferase